MTTRRRQILVVVVAVAFGVMVGWVGRGGGSAAESEFQKVGRTPATKSAVRMGRVGGGEPERVMEFPSGPISEERFVSPQSEADLEAIRVAVRSMVEEEPLFRERMEGVAVLLGMMNPQNASAIRDGFEESWAAGYDYDWERHLFLQCYGQVMGKVAVEEYADEPKRRRVIEGWSITEPEAAVEWVNELPDGGERDEAVITIMWGGGLTNGDYAQEVFESLSPASQERNLGKFMHVNRRRAGAPACAEVVGKLWERDDVSMGMKRYSLRWTDGVFQVGTEEDRVGWLETLEPEQLELLDQGKLPEEFREAGAGENLPGE